uniref:C2H2-type domain-containing protein n=1 Tax=Rhabditophanes sp. KR3021 TaxID=114890 RepID=A0AC35UDX8_9BILA
MENTKDLLSILIESLKRRQQSVDTGYGSSRTPSPLTSLQHSANGSLLESPKNSAQPSSSHDAMETGVEESAILKALAFYHKNPVKQFTSKRSSIRKDSSGLEVIGKIEKDPSARATSEQFKWHEVQVANQATGETNRTFQCLANGTCNKYFDNKKSLARHQLTHLTDQFYCIRCHQLFNRCCNCRRHQLKCNGTKTAADEFDMVKYHLHNNKKMSVSKL